LSAQVEGKSTPERAMLWASIARGRSERECGTAVPENKKAPLRGSRPHHGHRRRSIVHFMFYGKSFILPSLDWHTFISVFLEI
jgi:hypothetical protein